MAGTIARTIAMTKQQRSKLNWEGMSKWCCLSSHSDGTHHRPVLPPKWRWDGMSKPHISLVDQEPSAGIQNHRPAYSSPPPPPPTPLPRPSYDLDDPYYYLPGPACDSAGPGYGSAAPGYDLAVLGYCSRPLTRSPNMKYIDMGLLRPFSLPLELYKSSQEEHRPAHSDGTPAPRCWELKFKKPWRLPPGTSDDDRPAPQLCNVGSISNWEGRLKRYRLGHTFRPYPNYSVEDVVAERVSQIANFFNVPGSPNHYEYDDDDDDDDDLGIHSFEPEQIEYSLDELEGYFEFMDLAHELHSIDCLFPLLHHVLVYPHAACIRAKAAQLVTTMVHNNPRSQQLVMELHGLQPLWYNFTSDPNAISRTKALGAISALIRNNKPGIAAFREINGYAALGDALSSETVWFQRKALDLIQYLLHENSSDCNTVSELGLPCIMMHLASSDDAEVRVAALRGLLVLARNEEGTYKKEGDKKCGNSGQLVKNDDKLKQVLQELLKRISTMALEDLGAAREEIQLVDSLWNAFYNEPSSLGEKGLLVLPGKDASACDIASKLFDGNMDTELGLPSPRAWAAADPKLPIETLLL